MSKKNRKPQTQTRTTQTSHSKPQSFNPNLPVPTIGLSIIVKNFPENYVPQSKVVDFWGRDLMGLLYNSKNPLDFYQTMVIKNYDALVRQMTPKGMTLFRKRCILFNEKTGKFGEQALDGRLYEVQMLDKDFATQLPITRVEIINEKDPRTGIWKPVNIKTERTGNYAFILRHIGTNQIGESMDVWMEVLFGSTKMYTLDYDSCNRFTKANECSGPGMNGLECKWVDRKCVSSFGSSSDIKYLKKLLKKIL
jgi:hypothetical protein